MICACVKRATIRSVSPLLLISGSATDYINSHSIVIMDNASIHHVEEVVDLIKYQAGAKVCFLPPYSPDLMPAEGVLKSLLKQNHELFEVCTNPRSYLTLAFGMVTLLIALVT